MTVNCEFKKYIVLHRTYLSKFTPNLELQIDLFSELIFSNLFMPNYCTQAKTSQLPSREYFLMGQ